MLCRKPYSPYPGVMHGCGQCLHCRINRSRQWKWRQFMEASTHAENCFLTLTYSDDQIPTDRMLNPRALRLFINRLRYYTHPGVRFYGVGEYGPQTRRPHYHCSVFGVSGHTVVTSSRKERSLAETLTKAWPAGFVHIGDFNHVTAEYVSGYITKKLTDRKEGFEPAQPEFARMSNRPGIGATYMPLLARRLLDTPQHWDSGDVPSELRLGGRKASLGRYLLNRLRKEVGFTDDYIKELRACKSAETALDLLALFEATPNALTVREAYIKEVEGRLINVECRHIRSTWRYKQL
jgi:hypothetical protein